MGTSWELNGNQLYWPSQDNTETKLGYHIEVVLKVYVIFNNARSLILYPFF